MAGNSTVGALRVVLGIDTAQFEQGLKSAQRQLRTAAGQFKAMGAELTAIGGRMSMALTLPIAAFGVTALRAAGDFEQAMNRVQAVSGATGADLERLRRQAQDLGATTQFTASDAAEAMGFLAMAGMRATEILSAMPGTLQLAASAQLDMASAADIVTNVLSGYGMQVSELGRVNDVLVKSFTSANTDLRQLAEAMKYAGPVANAAGVQFEETAAALAMMGNAGIQASMAGTSLRGAISRILNPTKQMSDAMKAAGLNFRDAQGRLLPMVDVIRQLEPHANNAGLFMQLFGQRAGPAMAALVSQGADAVAELTGELENSAGTAGRIAAVQMRGFNGAMRELKSAFEAIQLAIADSGLMAFVGGLARGLASLFRELAKTHPALLQVGVVLAVVAAATGPLLLVLGALAASMGAILNMAALLAPSMAAFTASLRAATTGAGLLTIAIRGLRAAMAFLLGPWSLVIGAIAVAFLHLGSATNRAAAEQAALDRIERATAPAKTKLAELTAELASASRDRAAAIREEIAELINLQRVEAARLREQYNAQKQRARERQGQMEAIRSGARGETVRAGRLNAASPVMYEGLDIGPAPETNATIEARTAYEAQLEVVQAMEDSVRAADRARASAAAANDAIEDAASASAGSARDEARARARLLADLESQTALQEATLLQQAHRVREVEREAEMRARVQQLMDAGFVESEARRRSDEIQARLDDARERSLDRQAGQLARSLDLEAARIDEAHEAVRLVERQVQLEELIAQFAEVTADQAEAERQANEALLIIDEARLRAAQRAVSQVHEEHRIRVAQLSGNRELLRQLQDAEEIRRRTAQYRSQGWMSPWDAERQARDEVGRERRAADYGEQRQFFASTFSDGIRAALSGDIKNVLSNAWGQATDIAFQRIGERMYDSIFGGVDAVAQGTAQGTAQASAFVTVSTPSIVTAGSGAAKIMGTAIVGAGMAAAKAMGTAIAAAGGGGEGKGLVAGLSGLGKLFSGLPKFAGEGTIRPSGASAVDSQLVSFWKSPNEQVDIYRPGAAARDGQGGVVVHFAPVIHAEGAGPREVDMIKAEVEKMRQDIPAIAVGAVANARDRRIIS